MKSRIFISYSRKDGEDFAVDLRTRLAGVFGEDALWRDRDRMEGGRDWWQQIVAALEVVDFMVLVATPAAMESPIVRKEWRAARQMGVCVCPILDPKLPIDFNKLPRWMRGSHFYDISKEWNTFVAFLTAPCNVPRVPFMAPDLPANFVKRPGPFEELKARLLDSDRQNPIAVTTALQGAGGFGKTTLATALCHDEDIQTAFDDGILWIALGEEPNLMNELGQLYRALANEDPIFKDPDEGGRVIAEKLADLDCLIVIDDVWNSVHVRPFLRGGKRCVRLITTRDISIATDTYAKTTDVDEMLLDEAIELLGGGLEGADRTQLRNLAERLGEHAQMLEIANGMMRWTIAASANTIPGAMAWLTKRLDHRGILAVQRDDKEARNQNIANVLDVSIDLLKPDQRKRLYELGVFKEDEAIPISSVTRLWALDDFDTEDDLLIMSRLTLVKFSASTGTVRLHDIVRQYLRTRIDDICALNGQLINVWGNPYALPDIYAWTYYTHHLSSAEKVEDLCILLLDFHWLQAKLDATNAVALMADFDVLKYKDAFRLIQGAIRLSLGALTADKQQFAAQLAGRLFAHQENAEVATFIGNVTYAAATFMSLSQHFPSYIQAGGALLRTLDGHTDQINGALALHDGRLLSWAQDNTLRIWSSDGTPLCTLDGLTAAVSGALQIEDGRLLSWSEDGTLNLWTSGGVPISKLEAHTEAIAGALSLPNGRLLSWSKDNTLRLWTADGMPLRTLNGHTAAVNGVLALRNGRLLSWSYDSTLRLWTADGVPLHTLYGHRGWISGALSLPKGRLLSWSSDGTLRLWSANGVLLRKLVGHTDAVRGALALRDDRLFSWSEDGTLRLWTADGMLLSTLRGHTFWIHGAIELHDGRLLSWSYDGTLRLWTADGGFLSVLEGHNEQINGALELEDGRLLSWSSDSTLRLWTAEGGFQSVLEGHSEAVNGALMLDDGRLLSWAGDFIDSSEKKLRLWTVDTVPLRRLNGHSAAVTGMLILHNGRLLSWSYDGTLRLWTSDGALLYKLDDNTTAVRGVLSLPDGRLLSWSYDNMLRFWAADGTPLGKLHSPGHWVDGALALEDGRLLSWSDDRRLCLWTVDGTSLRTLDGHSDAVNGALALHDGRLLSWSDDCTLRLWTAAGESLHTLEGHIDRVTGAMALHDGRLLSWSSDSTLRLWTSDGVPLSTLEGHIEAVNGALALENGRLLSWAGDWPSHRSSDKALQLWMSDGSLVGTLVGHTERIMGALELPGGQLVSWSDDWTLRLWTSEGEPLRMLEGHSGCVRGVLKVQDESLLSWSDDNTMRLWDKYGNPLAVFYGDTPVTCCVVLSESPLQVAIGDVAGRVSFLQLVD